MIEIAASALADKLPQEERDRLRLERVSARTILRLFTPDHVQLHCWDGPDRWFNLDIRRRGPAVLIKNAEDTSRAAKAVRIDDKWSEFTRAMTKGKKPPRRESEWPKRRFPRRPKNGSRRRVVRDR